MKNKFKKFKAGVNVRILKDNKHCYIGDCRGVIVSAGPYEHNDYYFVDVKWYFIGHGIVWREQPIIKVNCDSIVVDDWDKLCAKADKVVMQL